MVITWGVWISTVAVWGILIGGLALDGIAQVSTGGPGFLPFERWFRKRTPATQGDFVLQGAQQLLQALGLTFVAAPMIFMSLMATVDLTTGWHPPGPPQIPITVGLVVF